MKQYKITIITVTNISEKFLKIVFKVLKNQSYKNFEHLFVDGNSSIKL